MIYVVAPNFRAFEHWCRENDVNPRREARYVVDGSGLRGFPEGSSVVVMDGWDDRKPPGFAADIRTTLAWARQRGIPVKRVSW